MIRPTLTKMKPFMPSRNFHETKHKVARMATNQGDNLYHLKLLICLALDFSVYFTHWKNEQRYFVPC